MRLTLTQLAQANNTDSAELEVGIDPVRGADGHPVGRTDRRSGRAVPGEGAGPRTVSWSIGRVP